ncbi:type VII secretion system-associated protein [Amycolatopsis rhabdoformis]|uniref:Type VII secretion system-associated protein n=1 Tax=Amycolatopsis rhabdoformis TaxID=1448059 RepID=A0ABZ1I646_9PSEU|nr:type VII secretion system-associated protein [Amycolatopsis rhabdoformis]WSE29850.1 type VII secretion system-associated protein [Amycolatopsis rhabdoformis]
MDTTPDPLPAELRERARQAPDSWLYVVDPALEGAEDVPGVAIAGAYRVDEHGEIAGAFVPNPDYRPSPLALGIPRPVNELEAALQAVIAGSGDNAGVHSALLEATVYVVSEPDRPVVAVPQEDGEVVPAYTSEGYLPEPQPGQEFRAVAVRELVDALAGRDLLLNPGSAFKVQVPGASLAG